MQQNKIKLSYFKIVYQCEFQKFQGYKITQNSLHDLQISIGVKTEFQLWQPLVNFARNIATTQKSCYYDYTHSKLFATLKKCSGKNKFTIQNQKAVYLKT
eukprot:TRINITY_DN3694_c0_g1_i1.p5 TRINITY_DN3694_c0_g1~~TRINITY_DN3694_c0_g1_i1.p5  ORF type:complete len:100 (-),score=2.17 TRINITY_DN3694_c0_g1_i1:413-712(-)